MSAVDKSSTTKPAATDDKNIRMSCRLCSSSTTSSRGLKFLKDFLTTSNSLEVTKSLMNLGREMKLFERRFRIAWRTFFGSSSKASITMTIGLNPPSGGVNSMIRSGDAISVSNIPSTSPFSKASFAFKAPSARASLNPWMFWQHCADNEDNREEALLNAGASCLQKWMAPIVTGVVMSPTWTDFFSSRRLRINAVITDLPVPAAPIMQKSVEEEAKKRLISSTAHSLVPGMCCS